LRASPFSCLGTVLEAVRPPFVTSGCITFSLVSTTFLALPSFSRFWFIIFSLRIPFVVNAVFIRLLAPFFQILFLLHIVAIFYWCFCNSRTSVLLYPTVRYFLTCMSTASPWCISDIDFSPTRSLASVILSFLQSREIVLWLRDRDFLSLIHSSFSPREPMPGTFFRPMVLDFLPQIFFPQSISAVGWSTNLAAQNFGLNSSQRKSLFSSFLRLSSWNELALLGTPEVKI